MNKNVFFAVAILFFSIFCVQFHRQAGVYAGQEGLPQTAFEGSVSASLAYNAKGSATTYYVRPDGGTSTQCTGLADAPYPGTGQGQACAWRHPFWALDGGGAWNISGGDTIIVAAGSYRMGFGADNTGWCDERGAFDCHLPPLPSGPDTSNPTRVMGEGWDAECPSPPELWGAERPWQVLNLEGSDHVEIRCLEITDRSGCVDGHSNSQIACQRDEPPYENQADCGIRASESEDVLLKDLNIHGLSSCGIHAWALQDWTVENVRIAGNGWVGWDGDGGGEEEESSNAGDIVFKNVVVEWNGCAESWPGESVNNCWGQTAGGYGDGLGTAATAGDWTFEDCVFRYNTSDGLDLLYHRLGGMIAIRRSRFYSNAGDQAKLNGDATVENSVMASNCGWFEGKSFTWHVDNCRAGGSALAMNLGQGDSVSMVNSTLAGHGDCLMIAECEDSSCDGSESISIHNSIFRGYPEFSDPSDTTCYIWFDQDDFYDLDFDYNVLYNLKMGELAASPNDIEADPLFADDDLDAFDGHLQKGSPGIDSGLPVGSLGGAIPDHDLESTPRPKGSGVDRGAYESAIPIADFTASPLSGAVPLIVSFADASSESPDSWLWNFGDGFSAGSKNPVHIFQQEDKFTVSLAVSNSYGTDIEEKTDFIETSACA